MSEAHNEPLTFEKVWAMFQETDRKMQETDRKMQETDRKMQETARQMQETDRQMKETDRRMKETDRLIGNLGNRFGELAEHLAAPGIVEKFNKLGFNFTDIAPKGREYNDPKTRQNWAEVDIVLENSEIVIAIEVKAKLTKQDVDDHLDRMEILRNVADSKSDKRKHRGAIAGAIVTGEVRNYAHKSGFYVIEQSGDTMKLDLPEGFTPRDW